MQYLSRNDIEQIASRIINQYKQAYIPDQHMCYNVDIVRLASLMGYEVEYVHITKDGSILGKTSSGLIWTRIYDDKMNELWDNDKATIKKWRVKRCNSTFIIEPEFTPVRVGVFVILSGCTFCKCYFSSS